MPFRILDWSGSSLPVPISHSFQQSHLCLLPIPWTHCALSHPRSFFMDFSPLPRDSSQRQQLSINSSWNSSSNRNLDGLPIICSQSPIYLFHSTDQVTPLHFPLDSDKSIMQGTRYLLAQYCPRST